MRQAATLAALEELYRRRYPDFLRTATALAGGAESGRDAVHDAFVSAVRGRRGYRGESSVEAWVWRIVVNSALRQARRRREPGPGADETIWTDRDAGEHAELRAAIGRLPERQRLMLFLRYYADLDYAAIAAATGVRNGTVGAELHAARAALLRHLKAVTVDE